MLQTANLSRTDAEWWQEQISADLIKELQLVELVQLPPLSLLAILFLSSKPLPSSLLLPPLALSQLVLC